jgi:glyoxylase-like metal-dependent hydrolase (beta-lactamase superfamily II)
MTSIFCPDLNALFTADLVYNDVHAWLGQGVTRENAEAWLSMLAEIKASYARSGVMIYPGHGATGGIELIDRIRVAPATSSVSVFGQSRSARPPPY